MDPTQRFSDLIIVITCLRAPRWVIDARDHRLSTGTSQWGSYDFRLKEWAAIYMHTLIRHRYMMHALVQTESCHIA